MVRLLSVILLLGLLVPAGAHSEQEETRLIISLSAEKLTLQYATSFPSAGGFTRLRAMDQNGDEEYSEEEKESFLNQRSRDYLAGLRVEQDGQPLTMEVVRQEALIDSNTVGLNKLKVYYTVEGKLASEPHEGTKITILDPVVGWNEVEAHGQVASVSGDIPGDVLDVVPDQQGWAVLQIVQHPVALLPGAHVGEFQSGG